VSSKKYIVYHPICFVGRASLEIFLAFHIALFGIFMYGVVTDNPVIMATPIIILALLFGLALSASGEKTEGRSRKKN